jgi:DNA-binding transcriptional LysR family regulator
MDTNRIRYFISLARTGSISKAAELHHISPAALSKAMKVFEIEVGQTLTLPHGRGLILTDYAKSIVPKLQSIVGQIDCVREGAISQSLESSVLKVATFEVFSTYFMSRAVRNFFPEFPCEIHEMIPGRMEEAVASGRVDLAITYIPIPHPELDFLRITDIEIGIFGHRSLVADAKIESVPFAAPVAPIEGSPNKVRGLDGWPDDAFPRFIRYRVQMLETALGLCREGLAVAYIPKFIARLQNELVLPEFQLSPMPLQKSLPRRRDSVFIVKRKSDHEGPTAKKLAHAVRKICR